jgi:acetoin utilization deacetylase AcuC-like enzyme
MLKIAYSPIYKYELPEGHRFPMMKYELLPEQLLYEGTVTNDHFFHPDALDDELILLTHTQIYLDKLNHQQLDKKEIRNIGFPMSDVLVRRGKHIANGTLMCAEYAMEFGIAMNIAGGTHHSFSDRGEGFCLFNDIAIAANILLHRGQVSQILIIDLDVHQGNGTAKIFEHEPRVFTFSMHGEKNYPTRKEVSNLDIGLPDKTDDRLYLQTLKETLPKLIDQVQPDFIFYLSGVDVLESDKLGRLNLSRKGCKERDRLVLQTCKDYKIPVAVSMGGGYSPMMTDIIDAHANTFRVAQDIYF